MICKLYLGKTIRKISVANFGYIVNDLHIVYNWPPKLYLFNTIILFYFGFFCYHFILNTVYFYTVFYRFYSTYIYIIFLKPTKTLLLK